MDIASHFAKLGQLRGMRVTVVLHKTVDPRDFPDRKALAQAVWDTVAGYGPLQQYFDDPSVEEIRRNFPIRNPVLWVK